MPSSRPVTPLIVELLEPRILYAADLYPLAAATMATVHESASSTAYVATTQAASATTSAAISNGGATQTQPRHELVLIDSGVGGYQAIAAQIGAGGTDGRTLDVLVIDSGKNGIDQIGDMLGKYQDLDAIHIISHGGVGELKLGDTPLNSQNLLTHAVAVSTWGNALAAGGDILLYGCDVAGSQEGRDFVAALGQLTGADVSASIDRTGAQELGGNWNLEFAFGQVQANIAVDAAAQAQFDDVLATYTVTTTANAGAGSLRQAITDANANAGLDTISFNIAGGGAQSIAPTSALPDITSPVIIDGTTEPGYSSAPIIELSGQNAGTGADGLLLNAGSNGSTIRGLVINRFTDSGIYITGSSNNTVAGNYIGTNAAGTAASANGGDGIYFDNSATNNTIGGATAADRNLISGNSSNGISLSGAGTSNNTIRGNYIGLNASGTAAIANANSGVNVVSGASANIFGGTTTSDRNVISGNAAHGVDLQGTSSNQVQGNYIGTNAAGNATIANATNGVFVRTGGLNNTIGGSAAGAGNLISGNTSAGVRVNGASTGNAILGNGTYSNTGLGIDLGPTTGVTANDGAKTAGSPNLLMDSPVITTARLSGTTLTLAGYVGSAAGQTTFATSRVEFFKAAADPSGFGEGQTYLGFLTTDANGNYSGTLSVTGVSMGDALTATATDAGNNTSEFGANATVSLGLSGRVFDDVNYAGGTGTAFGAGDANLANVRVELYNASNAFQGFTTTDASGNYSFAIGTAGTYAVRVVSATIGDADTAPAAGYRSGFSGAVAEQTYEFNGTVGNGGAGAAGGNDKAVRDAATANGAGIGDTNASVVVGASGVTGIDFGFAYNVVTNTVDNAVEGSFRQALLNSNAINGTQSIAFNVLGGGLQTIVPTSALPTISDVTVIDGTSQTGYVSTPLIQLTGTSAGSVVSGLSLSAGASGSTIQGLIINSFDNHGITLTGTTGVTIRGNYVGTNAAGTASAANRETGIDLRALSSNNVIGGATAADRNVISGSGNGVSIDGSANNVVQGNYIGLNASGSAAAGNSNSGVWLHGGATGTVVSNNVISGNSGNGVTIADSGTTGNSIRGNYIGTNAGGTAAFGNGQSGVFLYNGASGNTVGGTTAADRNVISGNVYGAGMGDAGTTGNAVTGNYIGTNASGTAALANNYGILIYGGANANTIGGATSGHRNIISGNATGISIDASASNIVQGNYIGLNANGDAAIGNTAGGILLSGGTTNTSVLSNVVSGNTGSGVALADASTTGNTVRGNYIGTNASGTAALANTTGIYIYNSAANNTIGGATAGDGNKIWYNTGAGIGILNGTGNRISGNTFSSNGSLAIDLSNNGVTANDVGDADTGANNRQNFPVISTATITGGSITIAGTLNSIASRTFRIELFANTAADASGYGEGEIYLGFVNAATNGAGNATFNFTGTGATVGQRITATATDSTLNNTSEFSVNVLSVATNNAPVITSNGGAGTASVSIFENATPVTTVTATDANGDTIAYSVGGGVDAAKFTINGATGALSFVSAPNFESPGDSNTDNVYVVQVNANDGNGGTATQIISVTVANINEAPAGAAKTVTTAQDAAYTFSIADFSFTDTADSPANNFTAVKITTVPLAGTLTNNSVVVTAGTLVTTADILANKLVFTPTAGASGANYANFTFQVKDDGGTTNGGVDLDPTARTMTINVAAVNQAPAGADKTITANEDSAYTITAADFGFTDANGAPPNNFLSVQITTLPGAGTLTKGGAAVLTGASILKTELDANLLVFTPAANANGAGYASFTFQVRDDGGTANSGTDLDASPNTITFNITAVNDAPAGTAKTVTAIQNSSYTFTVADFGFTDTTDSPANNFTSVKFTTVPLAGTLANNSVVVTAGTLVTTADILANKLVFTPTAGASGANYANFTFQVKDDGGTANGGVDLDPTARAMTINVTAVNQAPAGADKTITANEDSAYTLTAADFGFTDVNGAPANNLLSVLITTLPGAGTLTKGGAAVIAGASILKTELDANLLIFTPAVNTNGTGYASFTFQVRDDGGTANSGTDLDASPNTITINVTAVNQAPAGADKTITANEDSAYTLTAADFGFSDVNGAPANNFLSVQITTLPGAGTLTKGGAAIIAGASILKTEFDANLLVFTPAANANGAGYASFTFQVRDDGGTTNGGTDLDASPNTITFNITAVNDAPTGTAKTVTTLQDAAYTFSMADFGFSDIADSPANNFTSVKITTVPSAGTLANNGVVVTAGTLVTTADILANKLVFTPVAGASGANYANFMFQVKDDGGTANGGVDLDPTARAMTVNVTPGNAVPAITSNGGTGTASVSIFENTTSVTTVTATDANGDTIGFSIGGGVDAARFAINGATGVLSFVSAPDFETPGDGNTDNVYVVQVNANDGNGGTATQIISVTVANTNEAPAGTNTSLTLLEDNVYTFSVADFGFTDVDGNGLAAVVFSTLPSQGTLLFNGAAFAAGNFVVKADIQSGQLVYAPAANISGNNAASFTFQVRDDGGTANGGVNLDATPNTITFNISAVNDAPTGSANTVTASQDGAYIFSVGDFGFSDAVDSIANNFSSVKITTMPLAGTLTNDGVAVAAGTLVATADILANKLVFTPVVGASGANYANFTFQVKDNGGTANGGIDLDATARTMTINVTATPVVANQAPAGTDKTITANEDASYAFSAADFGFTDVNGAPANNFFSVKITTLPSAGSLTRAGVAIGAGALILKSDIDANLLAFTPAANANGAGYASFTFQVRDDGGTANSGIDLDATPNTITFNITAVNDAPTGSANTVTAAQDGSYTFSANDFGFSDAADVTANNFSSVKITTLPGAGSLTNNTVVVPVGSLVTKADIDAGRLVFTPAAGTSGANYANFTFQVNDDGGTANGGIDLDPAARTMTINVTAAAANQAPAGTDKTITANEDSAHTLGAADFGFADANGAPANNLLSLRITTLPSAGTLTKGGAAVTAGASILKTELDANLLVFTPAANANGAGYASFTFQVRDDGGTANGGADLDASPNTITFNITAINDAPSGTAKSVTTAQNSAYAFSMADFGFTDSADTPANNFTAVKIATAPLAGTLANNGAAVAAGTLVSTADILAGKLVFTPTAGSSGANYASFTFQVQDDGGGANLDPVAKLMSITVTPAPVPPPAANQPPTGTANTITMLEDQSYAFTVADFGFSDVNGAPANNFLSVRISTVPGAGTLTSHGVLVNAGNDIFKSDIDAGNLVFTPAANAQGSGYASFTFQVRDDGGGASLDLSPDTMAINVLSINDAPVAASKTVGTAHNAPYTFSTADFGFADPNDIPGNQLRSIRIGTVSGNGSLTNAGTVVAGGSAIAIADIASGRLTFTPTMGSSGLGNASFTFQVQDDGGTANGGVDLDPTVRTMTIDVAAAATTTATPSPGGGGTPANPTLPGGGNPVDPAAPGGDKPVVPGTSGGDTPVGPGTSGGDTPVNPAPSGGGNPVNPAPPGSDKPLDPAPAGGDKTVNRAPDGIDKVVTLLEDTDYVFGVGDFGFTDAKGSPENRLAGVVIVSLPADGALRLNGVAVTAGSVISAADLAAGKLVFAPAPNANGTAYAALAFQVKDDGGTDNGGADLDPTPNKITVNVTPVADPVVIRIPGMQTTNQDVSLAIPDSGASPVQVETVDVISGVLQISLSSADGTLTLRRTTGLTFSTGTGTQDTSMIFTGTLADLNSALSGLRFDPAAGFSGSTSIAVSAGDNGSRTTSILPVMVLAAPTPATTPTSIPLPEDGTPVVVVKSAPDTPKSAMIERATPVIVPDSETEAKAVVSASAQPVLASEVARPKPPAASVAAVERGTPVVAGVASIPSIARLSGNEVPAFDRAIPATTAQGTTFAAPSSAGSIADAPARATAVSLDQLLQQLRLSLNRGVGAMPLAAASASEQADILEQIVLQMPDSDGTASLTAQQIEIVAALSSLGIIWLAGRKAALAASLLTSLPAWQRLDPLHLLEQDDDDGAQDDDQPDIADHLFHVQNAARPGGVE